MGLRKSGAQKWVDENGEPVSVNAKAWFPQTSIGKNPASGGEPIAGGGGGGGRIPGAKASFQRARTYKTEAEGAAAGIIY
jgi:hypothetical protein